MQAAAMATTSTREKEWAEKVVFFKIIGGASIRMVGVQGCVTAIELFLAGRYAKPRHTCVGFLLRRIQRSVDLDMWYAIVGRVTMETGVQLGTLERYIERANIAIALEQKRQAAQTAGDCV